MFFVSVGKLLVCNNIGKFSLNDFKCLKLDTKSVQSIFEDLKNHWCYVLS